MKIHVLFSLLVAVGCIVAAGCVATKNKDSMNVTATASIVPFSNTSDTSINKTINATANVSSKLKGSLRVSISGIKYPVNLSVILDNETVGTVEPTAPLFLMISEGNHTVMVCVNPVCEQKDVTTRFGTYVTVDFSDQLQKDVEFPNPTTQPTARILGYTRNGNTVSVDIEFTNPSTKDLQMSVVVSCGYNYIDDRTGIKVGDSIQRMLVQNVKAGQRITERMYLSFARDNILNYSSPVIEELQIK